MKKAKLMLTAIAVVTVVGGAFAFKAKTIRNFYSADTSGKCTLLQQFQYDVATSGTTINYTTDQGSNAPCSAIVQDGL